MRWFRSRKQSQEQAPREAAAPRATPEPVSTEPADPAGQSTVTKPRRRRGNRGGRARTIVNLLIVMLLGGPAQSAAAAESAPSSTSMASVSAASSVSRSPAARELLEAELSDLDLLRYCGKALNRYAPPRP